MNSIHHPLLLFAVLVFSQLQLVLSKSQSRIHHRYAQTNNNENAANNDEITNEDTILDVSIIPPLRLNIYETPKDLSTSGKDAIVKAMNEHATYRLQIYFRNTIYFFDKVEFELVESHTLERVVQTRNLRSFEREEVDAREDFNEDEEKTSLRRKKDVDFTQSNHGNHRNLQERTMYGTSLLLGGKIKFSLFPSASSAECNKQLYLEMQRDWFMNKYIENQSHAELANVKQWFIKTAKETSAPSPFPSSMPSSAPSLVPSSEPASQPSGMPSLSPSLRPSLRPSMQPSEAPSMQPSSSPSSQKPSLTPSAEPSLSPKPTQLYKPSTHPSNLPSSIPSDAPSEIPLPRNALGESKQQDDDGSSSNIIPILVASALVTVVIFVVSGMFMMKKRKDKSHQHAPITSKQLGHKRLADDDDGDSDHVAAFADEDPFSSNIPSLLSTNVETNSTDSDEQGDYFSEASAIASSKTTISFSSSQTIKRNNVSEKEKEEIEKKWMAQSPTKNTTSDNSKPPKPPSSVGRVFPIKLNPEERLDDFQKNDTKTVPATENSTDDVSPKNISLQVVGEANGVVSGGNSIGPSLMKFFVKSDRGDGSKSHSRSSSIASSPGQKSSPITTVTPSKVSKEEFEKGWDVDSPLNWNENEIQNQPKVNDFDDNNDIENAFNAFNDVDGSFPTFDENEQPEKRKSTATKLFPSIRSVGESTAYQSANELHPLDWSNKGSEYDGTSIGESTYTDGDNTNREMNHVSWDQVNINATGGKTPLGINNREVNTTQYMTPMTNDFRTPKSTSTDPSRTSGYGSSSVCGSSPSSRGSSKQLINDLVWLEKKIADVRKRVDRLDGDDSTCSPPRSPTSADLSRAAGSPISHNIICRDVIAPPGKLNIVIHSTKDGPAIHSVKPGSVLEGQMFKGDLVVAVDDTDTRSYNAVDVMGMMTQKSDCERKITVIHFDNYET